MATKKASTAGKKSASRARSSARRTSVRDEKTGTQPPRQSVAQHSEHPETPSDSTVRHADNPVGRRSAGTKGFPQGEYDVDPPARASGRKQSVKDTLLEQHQAGAEPVDEIQKRLKAKGANRLSAEERSLATETLPIGAVIEHEGPHRWRVRAPTGGGNRFGHGQTAQEAIEHYVLGSSIGNTQDAAAQAYHDLPAKQQKEIDERDAANAKARGIDPASTPEAIARREFVANQKAAQNAKAPAANATTDGPEIASAQFEAGRRRGNPESQALDTGKDRPARNRSSARRRTGGKAKR